MKQTIETVIAMAEKTRAIETITKTPKTIVFKIKKGKAVFDIEREISMMVSIGFVETVDFKKRTVSFKKVAV